MIFELNENYVPFVPDQVRIDLLGWTLLEHFTEREFQLLFEVGDYVPDYTDVTHISKNRFPYLKNYRVLRNELGDHAITFERDGAVEIHHATVDHESGKILTHEHGTGKPNAKFVTMMAKIGKEFIDSGKTVRISAPTEMLEKYHRIMSYGKFGLKNAHFSDPEFHKFEKNDHGDDVEYKQFYVSSSPINKAVKILDKMKVNQ